MGDKDGFFNWFNQAKGEETSQPAAVTRSEEKLNAKGGAYTDPSNELTKTQTKNNTGAGQDTPASVLDSFQQLIQSSGSKKPEQDMLRTSLDLPDEGLRELANGQSFAPKFTDEQLTQLREGNPEAFVSALNDTGRQAYQQAMKHISMLFNSNMDTRLQGLNTTVESSIKNHLTSSAVSDSSSKAHPLVQQQLSLISKQLREANPNATPAQIATRSQELLKELANNLTEATMPAAKENPTTDEPYDAWMKLD